MNRWDHFDVIIAVGVCATVLGAGMFWFAFGGAPTGLLDQRLESAAPPALDPEGVTQAALGQAIVESGATSHLEGAPWGFSQERLGGAIMTAVRAERARAGLMQYFRDEARESLSRMQGMIQEKAGRSVARAARHMWRDGTTESAQLQFIEMLGRIRADMILSEQAAIPQREEFLGWTVVGRLRAMNGYQAGSQEQFGSAVRDAGIMAARLDRDRPVMQESLGAAVLVAARVSASSEGASPVLVASAGGFSADREAPYQAGAILFAAVFVMAWGLRSVAETEPGLSASLSPPARFADDQYRKAG